MNRKSEKGAVIVEGTMSLAIFMFLMFSIYSVIQIAYCQERVAIAMDVATKEVSEFAHVYFLMEIDEAMSGPGKSSELASKVANNQIVDFLKEIAETYEGSTVGEYSKTFQEALQSFDGDSIGGIITNHVGEKTVELLMRKNLNAGSGTDVEAFKKKYHIVGDFDLGRSTVFNNGSAESKGKYTTDLFMVCEYDIEVPILEFFNIKKTFHMRHCSYTQAWGG